MSERGKPTEDTLKQDIENLAFGDSGRRKSLAEIVEENQGSSLVGESDRSLANIHTGDRDAYDESTRKTETDGSVNVEKETYLDVDIETSQGGEQVTELQLNARNAEAVFDLANDEGLAASNDGHRINDFSQEQETLLTNTDCT